ncbi:MAG TPA: hypothetical protein IAB67_04955 [Candidatus Ventrousia excrementavium]|uniref:Uncharacterized protein n=1 Tax=Candidatus Ventrousia excrementavium TaxID=2840961 RepID=A0A9D1LLK8_9CLOT|nr:hypothetical protein [Candidatus Ventrousia excrementavium]
MYNRYMNSGGFEDFFKPVEAPAPPPAAEPEVPVAPVEPTENKPKGLSSVLKNLTGGGLKLPEFDTDTLLLLVLVYFLIADDDSNLSDTLLIIGILLLLGF